MSGEYGGCPEPSQRHLRNSVVTAAATWKREILWNMQALLVHKIFYPVVL